MYFKVSSFESEMEIANELKELKRRRSQLLEEIDVLERVAEEVYIFFLLIFLGKKRLTSFDFNAYRTESASK